MSFFSSIGKSSGGAAKKAAADLGPVTHEIFVEPPKGCLPKKIHHYDEAQQAKIKVLREYAHSIMLNENDPYYPWEARFLADPGCIPRYCRAAKWQMPNAKNRIKGTMEWRREYKPELIAPDDVGIEAETGKIIITGFDVDARPVIYMRPGRENTEKSPRQIRHLIFNLERAIDLMPPNQEQVVIIVDYASATSQSNPSISTARHVLGILQNHYVERMGRAIVVRMPWWVNAFFSGISPFLDPVTRDKMRFNPNLTELIPAKQLDKEFGGEYNFEYNYKTYWKTLMDFCHLTPNGKRVDKDGKECVPPLGYGAKAAAEGIPGSESQSAQNGATTKANDQATSEQPVANGETPMANGQAASEQVAATGPTEKEIANPSSTLPVTSTDEATTKLDAMSVSSIEPPAVATKPGPPEGAVVFDHEPTQEETEAAALNGAAVQV